MENLDTFHQPIKCQEKLMNQILANQIAALITAFKRQQAIIAHRVLFCVDNARIHLHISKTFCTLESQIFAMFIYFWMLN